MNDSIALTPDQLYAMLDAEGIVYEVVHHQPIFTVDQARSIRPKGMGDEGQVKNLFLKNKKGRMWLLTLHEGRKIVLDDVAQALGARRFSFCSSDRLMNYLGVLPGSVSPFALLNDREKKVQFYIDEGLVDCDLLHVHPLKNSSTVSITCKDLIRFLEKHGHVCHVLSLNLDQQV
ncbi:MAG: prolyl-tRNA synthetase associated domain-containing protein [Gammaproteobacteria bacterium]|nr:prolyl-tRNA synthetase associated domain-containing protein [Gammaproteobacteria bacterium]MCY4218392.1 prolyl-tRNA synthetase associated domain-containing protein [Gammaproteobacteria bacterium]MCY4275571.1 prolyl-tRNA synthetase associated domain-containing protein [Gammaproteobacteria bacterium]